MTRVFISLIFTLWAGLAYADQSSIVVPETNAAFNTQFGTTGNVTFGPAAHYAINPALRTIAGNFSGTTCTGIASPVPYQWCVDTTARKVKIYTLDSGGLNPAFRDALTINSDGSLLPVMVNPTFTGTMGGDFFSGRELFIEDTVTPFIRIKNSSAPNEAQRWRFQVEADGFYHLCAMNAANSVCNDALGITRSGNTVTNMFLPVQPTIGLGAATLVADNTTDNCSVLNSALAAGDVQLPGNSAGFYYRSSCTIVVPFGSSLRGVGRTTPPGITQIGGTKIVCDPGVSPCIQVGTGTTNQTASVYNIYQGRTGGVPGSTTIGIWVLGGEGGALVDVTSDNNGINFLWGRNPTVGAGVSLTGTRLASYRAVDAHMMFDGVPDVRISDSRIGSVASDYNAQSAFRFSCTLNNCSGAGGTNTINVVNTQVNQAAHRIECFADFKNADSGFVADYGEFHFDNVHAEVLGHGICSDSSWKAISALIISNSFITSALTTAEGPGGKFLNLNAVTKIDRWRIMGSELFAADEGGVQAFRFNPSGTGGGIYELKILGSTIYGNTYISGYNSSSAQLLGSTFTGTYTADGSWSYYTEIGTNVLGAYTDNVTTTGNAAIYNNQETRIGTTLGVTCGAGITAGTVTVKNGILTHC